MEQKEGSIKKALIITADRFEDLEVYYPMFRLREAGWTVKVAAPGDDEIKGKHGYRIQPDLRIDDSNPDEFDLLVLPGGPRDGAPEEVRQLESAKEIVRSFFEKDKPVAAICHGPYTLISADLVQGRIMTSFPGDQVPKEIMDAGGKWIDEEVVVDANLITSRYPKDLPAFMRSVFEVVESKKKERTLS